MLNSGGAIREAGPLLDTPDGNVRAELTCRGPGRLHAYAQPAPTVVLLEVAGECLGPLVRNFFL